MKKIVFFYFFRFTLSTFSYINARASNSYINSNGVKITGKYYEKMLMLGLLEKEINIFTKEEVKEYKKLDIKYVVTNKKYIETTYF